MSFLNNFAENVCTAVSSVPKPILMRMIAIKNKIKLNSKDSNEEMPEDINLEF